MPGLFPRALLKSVSGLLSAYLWLWLFYICGYVSVYRWYSRRKRLRRLRRPRRWLAGLVLSDVDVVVFVVVVVVVVSSV